MTTTTTTPPEQKQKQKQTPKKSPSVVIATTTAAPVITCAIKKKESAMVLDISRLLFARHLRAEPTSHVLFFKDGALRKSGPGLAFWFMPLGASVSAVPLDDRELPILIKGRTADFQEVTVNGAIVWRVARPQDVARRVDFSVDVDTGAWTKEPLDRVAATLTQLANQLALVYLTQATLRQVLKEGNVAVRAAIHDGLIDDAGLAQMGVEIVATRVSSVLPTSEMEKALQMPTREKIQQEADEATFGRRALAVDKERAIQENELGNQIELARREEQLIAQRGQNERRRATETAESKRIEVEASAKNVSVNATAQADSIRLLEEAKVHAEKERMAIYKELSPHTMMGLAARELAGTLQSIEHLTISPDMLGSMLQRVLGAGAQRLEAENDKA